MFRVTTALTASVILLIASGCKKKAKIVSGAQVSLSNPSASAIDSVKTLVWGFKKGDIAHFPRPVYNGVALPTWQVDQVRRWSDGSVKVAIVSFPISFAASQGKMINWADDLAQSSSGAAMTSQEMLNFMGGRWNAAAKLAYNGLGQQVSARTMLQDDVDAGRQCGDPQSNCTYWLRGPVVTEMVLQGPLDDQTNFFKYTMGFDEGHGIIKPIRPVIALRAYPSWPTGIREEVQIRADMGSRLELLNFDYSVLNGPALTNTVYAKAGVSFYPTTTFRKVAWDGEAPPVVNTANYNVAYKADSGLFPHWDATVKIASGSTLYWQQQWNKSDKCADPTSHGTITQNFNLVGGRWDIGPTTQAHVLALYAPGPMRVIALGESDCSAMIPFHLLDTRAGTQKFCPRTCTDANAQAPAFGRFPSPEARPTWLSGRYGITWDFVAGVAAADKIQPIYFPQSSSVNGWTLDGSHHPDLWYTAFFLSDGERYYVDEIVNFALYLRAADTAGTLGYQHHNWWAISHYNGSYQARGYAWGHRTLGGAVTLLDQSDPRYQFLTKHWEYDARVGEGAYEIVNGKYPPADPACTGFNVATSNAVADMWCWGKLYVGRFQNASLPQPALWSNANAVPLPAPRRAANKPELYPFDWTKIVALYPPWMSHYKQIIATWNGQRELGYDDAVQQREATGEMRMLMSPGHNRWLAAEAEWPSTLDDGHGAGDAAKPGRYIITTDDWRSAWLNGFVSNGAGSCDDAPPFDFDAVNFWRCSGYWAYSSSTHSLETYAYSFRATAAGWVGLQTIALDGSTPITGRQVWDWVNSDEAKLRTAQWGDDPRYAIVP